MKYNRIGLTGKALAGKTTAAEYLRDNYGFVILSFSSKIKKLASELFGMQEKDRKLLQQLGTKMREINGSVWVDYLINQIESYRSVPIVVDDVRLIKESLRLKSHGFLIVKIKADNGIRMKRQLNLYGKSMSHIETMHQTEKEVDKIDTEAVIVNNWNFKVLYEQLDKLLGGEA